MKKGFTLAEILITLGIVGVVATLTLPTLMNNHQKRVYVTRIQKVYNQTENSLQQYFEENNSATLNSTHLTKMDGVKNFLLEYYKIAKDCGESPINASACLADSYKDLSGNDINLIELTKVTKEVEYTKLKPIGEAEVGDKIESDGCIVKEKNEVSPVYAEFVLSCTEQVDGGNFYCAKLNSGAALCMQPQSGQIVVDTNSTDLPNTKGRDLFLLTVNEKGSITDTGKEDCENNTTLKGCFNRIMDDNWKMNY